MHWLKIAFEYSDLSLLPVAKCSQQRGATTQTLESNMRPRKNARPVLSCQYFFTFLSFFFFKRLIRRLRKDEMLQHSRG